MFCSLILHFLHKHKNKKSESIFFVCCNSSSLSKNKLSLKQKHGKLWVEFALSYHKRQWNDVMMNCFCGTVDRRKEFSLISIRYHYQRSSPSRISDKPRVGFEPAQNLSSGLIEWSCTAERTATSPRHKNVIYFFVKSFFGPILIASFLKCAMVCLGAYFWFISLISFATGNVNRSSFSEKILKTCL